MSFPTQLAWYAAALLVPFIATLLLTPVAGRLAHRLDILDVPRHHKSHHNVTPYLGGLAVGAGLLLIGAIAASVSTELLAIVVGAVAILALGFEDDRRDLGPIIRLSVEIAAGVVLWIAGVRVTFFDMAAIDLILTVGWVVAITNSLNLLDNMDGLTSGTAAIASFTFFGIAAWRGDYAVAGLSLGVAGASLGFLRHNFPPARIFLGDAGSLFLGFMLAALALKLDLIGQSGAVRAAVPILILGVPIFDMILVILARTQAGRPIHQGGTDHSSHRLTHMGLSGRSVALIIYAIQIVLSGVALVLMLVSGTPGVLVLAVIAVIGFLTMAKMLTMEHALVQAAVGPEGAADTGRAGDADIPETS